MRAKKVDANQPALVSQMRKIGMSVQVISMVGEGCPDLLVGYRGRNILLELKDPSQPPSKRKLTPDEELFHATWKGQVSVVETIEDVLKIVNHGT